MQQLLYLFFCQNIIEHFADKSCFLKPLSRFLRIGFDTYKPKMRINPAGPERVCNGFAGLGTAVRRTQHAALPFQNQRYAAPFQYDGGSLYADESLLIRLLESKNSAPCLRRIHGIEANTFCMPFRKMCLNPVKILIPDKLRARQAPDKISAPCQSYVFHLPEHIQRF